MQHTRARTHTQNNKNGNTPREKKKKQKKNDWTTNLGLYIVISDTPRIWCVKKSCPIVSSGWFVSPIFRQTQCRHSSGRNTHVWFLNPYFFTMFDGQIHTCHNCSPVWFVSQNQLISKNPQEPLDLKLKTKVLDDVSPKTTDCKWMTHWLQMNDSLTWFTWKCSSRCSTHNMDLWENAAQKKCILREKNGWTMANNKPIWRFPRIGVP